MSNCLRRIEGPDPSQYLRALERGRLESQSIRRLATAFAEEDAELARRLGEDVMAGYRFRCQYCGSQFSLEQQRDAHELECGRMGGSVSSNPGPEKSSKILHCRRCGAGFPSLKDLAAHVRAEHAAEFREAATAGYQKRREEIRRIDGKITDERPAASAPVGSSACTLRALAGHAQISGVVATAPIATSSPLQEMPGHATGNGHTCPTCGGTLPTVTAQLVAALQAEGLAETQSFAAARIARRILGAATG